LAIKIDSLFKVVETLSVIKEFVIFIFPYAGLTVIFPVYELSYLPFV
jgi:hypothetical protein